MRHRNPATERITGSFERFNAYAQEALKRVANDDDWSDVYAILAIAFELGQLRYLLSGKNATAPADSNLRKVEG